MAPASWVQNVTKLIDMNYNENIQLECACCDISELKWDELMNGSKKANGSKIRKLIKNKIPDLYNALALDFNNPYESQSQKTNTHYIYVHSAIEYFLEILK
jgi:hypothetical protein